MTKNELIKEIEEMAEMIDGARLAFQNGTAVELGSLQERVRDTVTAVQMLPAEDAQAVRPRLAGLLEDMQAFSQELQERIDTLNEADAESDGADEGEESDR